MLITIGTYKVKSFNGCSVLPLGKRLLPMGKQLPYLSLTTPLQLASSGKVSVDTYILQGLTLTAARLPGATSNFIQATKFRILVA